MPFLSDYSGRQDQPAPPAGGPREAKFARYPHYYGDVVRGLFVLGAILMLLTLPIFSAATPFPAPVSLAIIAVLGLAAGFTSPEHKWTASLNLAIALSGVLGFGYHAVRSYALRTPADLFFWINQVLALVFLIALYYSAKTARGLMFRGRGGPSNDTQNG